MNWGLKSILLLVMTTILCIWGNAGTSQAADPVQANDISDGIENWAPQDKVISGYRGTSNKSLTLGYGFDVMGPGGNTNMVSDTYKSPYGPAIINSKTNVWIEDANLNQYYAEVFNYGVNPSNQQSLEFAIAYSPAQTQDDYDTSILFGMTGKRYFTGTDKDGNQAQKVMGTYTKTDSAGVTHNFEMEIVLRPDPTNSTGISQELYMKNTGASTQQYGIFMGEAIQSGTNSINALPNNSGMYFRNANNIFQFNVPVKLKDGPTNYTASNYSVNNNYKWLAGFSPASFDGKGVEAQNLAPGTTITFIGSLFYTLKWPYASITPGETKHYHAEISASKTPYVTANVTKAFKNETSTDGENRIGDKLKFTVTANNDGYNSQWSSLNLNDVIPDGLQLDSSTMQMTTPSGTQAIPASAYNAATKTLNFASSASLSDFQTATFTFETTIQSTAASKTLTNNATVSGKDANVSGTPNVSATGSVDIPVEKNPYQATFTKQVKNKTAGDTNFQNSTNGVYGDTVAYQIKYGVNADSQYDLASGQLQDRLPDGLTLVPGSIKMTANGTTSSPTDLTKITLPKLTAGQTATINFDTKVTGTTPVAITNNATMSGTNNDNVNESGQSNDAVLKPGSWVGFMSLPDQIDFGTHENNTTNFTNQSTKTAGSTAKTLVVENYSTNPKYQVNVAYDNSSAHKFTDAKGDTITPSDNQNLIFFKDITTGNWVAVTPSGTPLNSAGFSQTGLNDLTTSVGAGKWRMSNRTYQPKAGTYNGTLTWQVTNSL